MTAIPAGGTVKVSVAGVVGVPSSAKASLVNLTGANAAATTYLTMYPSGTKHPATSKLNVRPGSGAAANFVLAKPGSDQTVTVTIYNASARAVHAIVDVTGYVR